MRTSSRLQSEGYNGSFSLGGTTLLVSIQVSLRVLLFTLTHCFLEMRLGTTALNHGSSSLKLPVAYINPQKLRLSVAVETSVPVSSCSKQGVSLAERCLSRPSTAAGRGGWERGHTTHPAHWGRAPRICLVTPPLTRCHG